MIFKETNSALATALTNAGKTVVPTNNSVLNNVEIDYDNQVIKCEAVATKIATVLSKEITFYRNYVIPFIKKYAGAVNEDIAKHSQVNPISKFKIERVYIPKAIDMLNDLNKFDLLSGESNVTLMNANISFVEQPAKEIRKILKSAFPLQEKEVVAYTDEFDDDYLVSLWDRYMSNVTINNDSWKMLDRISTYEANEAFLLFLIFSAAKNDIIDSRASLKTYETTVDLVLIKLKNRIGNLIHNLHRDVKRKNIILFYNETKLYINQEVYNEYIKTDGADIQILLGAVVSNDIKTTILGVEKITSIKNTLKKEWDGYVKANDYALKVEASNLIRHSYSTRLSSLFTNELSDTVKQELNIKLEDFYNEVLSTILNGYELEELYDTDKVTEEVACSTIFKVTNVDKFLKYCKKYEKLNSNYDANEIATLASTDLILDYILTQVEVA